MLRALHRLGVKIETDMPVREILIENGRAVGVKTVSGAVYPADAVIVAAGGASYPATGSNGDGSRLAEAAGHSIVELRPSLVPLEVEEDWIKETQGLSLRNVKVTALADGQKIGEEFGEMMFAHFGVTGPIILSLSRVAVDALRKTSLWSLLLT